MPKNELVRLILFIDLEKVTYLGTNVTKDVKNLYNENCKTLKRKIRCKSFPSS